VEFAILWLENHSLESTELSMIVMTVLSLVSKVVFECSSDMTQCHWV